MSITRTPKKLVQAVATTTASQIYTVPQDTITQVVEIWVSNSDSTDHNLTLYAHGLQSGNVLGTGVVISATSFERVTNCKIVLEQAETLGVESDDDTSLVVTAYGIEETEVS